LEALKDELYKVDVNLMTVNEVLGDCRQMRVTEVYRSIKEMGNLFRKIPLEIAVNEHFVEPTINAIMKGGRTGAIGEGKLFFLNLSDCIRILSGERGGEAIG
jgi:nitrogen regulatory protein P-II 1